MAWLHPSEDELPDGQEARDAAYVDFALDLVQKSADHYSQFRSSLESRYDIVRGYFEAQSGVVGWNEVPVGFLFSMLQSDVARKSLILHGEIPKFQLLARQGQEHIAKKRAMLLEEQYDAADCQSEVEDFLLTADLYGRAIGRYHWHREYGSHYTRERTWLGERIAAKPPPRTGIGGVTFDGPKFYNVDPIDFFPWPGIHKLDRMIGAGEQLFPNFEDIVVASLQGPNGEPPIYNPRAVEGLRYQAGDSREVAFRVKERLDMASGTPVDRLAAARVSWAKPCWVIEVWMQVPRDFAVWDPERRVWTTHVVITVLNGKHLLRVAPNPHWDNRKPYFSHAPIVDPHFFWGPGKVEIGMRLQAAINKYVSRGLDFLDLYLDPSWLVDENSGIDPDQLFTGPGNTILANGDVSEKAIRQIIPDLRGYNISLEQIGLLWQWLQQTLGMSADISLGAGEVGSDRQTAHEWVGRESAINLRARLELLRFEREALIPILNAFQRMNRQWLPFPVELGLLGEQAIYDVGSRRFIPPEQMRLDLEEMFPEMPPRPLGLSRQLSVQARQANVERLLPLLGPFMAALNMRSFVADILPLYGFYDVASKLNSPDEMRAALQAFMQFNTQLVGGELGRGRPNGRSRGAQQVPVAQ